MFIYFFLIQFFIHKIKHFKNAHKLLKNRIIIKHLHTNSDKVLTSKFHNKLIYFNIKANEAKHKLFNIDLLCYKLVRQRQQIGVVLNTILLHCLNRKF